MKRTQIIFLILISWILPTSSQPHVLSEYVFASEYIFCGRVISVDTTRIASKERWKSECVLAKLHVLSKLKGDIVSDTIQFHYYSLDLWEHSDPPELHVDSVYLGFMKYSAQKDLFEPHAYHRLCFSPISPAQIPLCESIVSGFRDSHNLDSCRFFEILMEGVEVDLELAYRSLDDHLYHTSDLQTQFCIDSAKSEFLYKAFCKTHNTTLVNYTGDQYREKVDSVLLSLIAPTLIRIEQSNDIYDFEEKSAVYDYTKHLSFVRQNVEYHPKLEALMDLMFSGTHAEFTNLVKEIISNRR